MKACYADLHLHTTASDGTQTIDRLVTRAAAVGLSIIAVTDHDTISPELTRPTQFRNGIEVITGAEFKVDFDGIRGELLGYFIDPRAAALVELFSRMRRARDARMEEMVARCREVTGARIEIDEVRRLAAGSIGRPHLARILVQKGIVTTTREAFDTLIGSDKPCYVPIRKPNFREVAAAVHGAGGLTSIPHPCLMDVPDWGDFLSQVKREGVDGVEVFYPYQDVSRPLSIPSEEIRAMAEKYGFLLTGGSDDHGPDSVKEQLGKVKLPCRYVERMREFCRG